MSVCEWFFRTYLGRSGVCCSRNDDPRRRGLSKSFNSTTSSLGSLHQVLSLLPFAISLIIMCIVEYQFVSFSSPLFWFGLNQSKSSRRKREAKKSFCSTISAWTWCRNVASFAWAPFTSCGWDSSREPFLLVLQLLVVVSQISGKLVRNSENFACVTPVQEWLWVCQVSDASPPLDFNCLLVVLKSPSKMTQLEFYSSALISEGTGWWMQP